MFYRFLSDFRYRPPEELEQLLHKQRLFDVLIDHCISCGSVRSALPSVYTPVYAEDFTVEQRADPKLMAEIATSRGWVMKRLHGMDSMERIYMSKTGELTTNCPRCGIGLFEVEQVQGIVRAIDPSTALEIIEHPEIRLGEIEKRIEELQQLRQVLLDRAGDDLGAEAFTTFRYGEEEEE